MKNFLLVSTFLLSYAFVIAYTPPPIASELTDPANVLPDGVNNNNCDRSADIQSEDSDSTCKSISIPKPAKNKRKTKNTGSSGLS